MKTGTTHIALFSACALLAACNTGLLGPDSQTKTLVQQVQQLRQSGQSQTALSTLQDARARSPRNPYILQQLGYTLIETNQAEEAIGVFDELIGIAPDNAMAHNGKAVAFDHLGNHLAAQDMYKTALSLTPSSLSIKNNLAFSLLLNQQPQQAIELLEPLLGAEDSKQAPIVRRNLALAYKLTGNSASLLALYGGIISTEQAKANDAFFAHYKTIASAEAKGKMPAGKPIIGFENVGAEDGLF